jgi:hypothetical protein
MALLAAAATGHGHQVSLSVAPTGREELPVMTSKAIRSGGSGAVNRSPRSAPVLT